MKKTLLLRHTLVMPFFVVATWATAQNQSAGSIATTISPTAPSPVGTTERFRFGTGIVTQLENQGTNLFDFTASDQWLSFGRLNSPSQTLYGFRTQRAGRGLVMGFTGAAQSGSTPTLGTPFIQWVGNSGIGVTPGDLDFRVATSPTTGVSSSTRVFRLGANGSSVFGPIDYGSGARLELTSNDKSVGLFVITNPGDFVSSRVGIQSEVESSGSAYGVLAVTRESLFNYPVYGAFSDAQSGGFISAGYFAGGVYANGFITLSDKKLKNSIRLESSKTLELVKKLKPVTYKFNESTRKSIGGSEKLQHGFLAQEVEEVFPEMVEVAKHPTFEKGKLIATTDYKAVNYQMLIPVLTKAIQELTEKVELLEEQLNNLRTNQKQSENSSQAIKQEFSMSQNNPNPFTNSTIIQYEVPINSTNSVIAVYDLSGKQLKQFRLSGGKGQLTFDKGSLPSGMYLYSLIHNGEEKMTSRMVIQ